MIITIAVLAVVLAVLITFGTVCILFGHLCGWIAQRAIDRLTRPE